MRAIRESQIPETRVKLTMINNYESILKHVLILLIPSDLSLRLDGTVSQGCGLGLETYLTSRILVRDKFANASFSYRSRD